MAKYYKRHFNVAIFIVLLLFAFIPGIIYAIYCAMPVKVCEEEPKNNGWLLTFIATAVTLANCVLVAILLMDAETVVFYVVAAFAVIPFISMLLNRKVKSGFLLTMTLVFSILTAAMTAFYFGYYFVAPLSCLVAIIGHGICKKYYNYHKYIGNEKSVEVNN